MCCPVLLFSYCLYTKILPGCPYSFKNIFKYFAKKFSFKTSKSILYKNAPAYNVYNIHLIKYPKKCIKFGLKLENLKINLFSLDVILLLVNISIYHMGLWNTENWRLKHRMVNDKNTLLINCFIFINNVSNSTYMAYNPLTFFLRESCIK